MVYRDTFTQAWALIWTGSQGLVTNFADVLCQVPFAQTFIDTFPSEGDLPPRLHC